MATYDNGADSVKLTGGDASAPAKMSTNSESVESTPPIELGADEKEYLLSRNKREKVDLYLYNRMCTHKRLLCHCGTNSTAPTQYCIP